MKSNYTLGDVEELVADHSDLVDFGTVDNSVDDIWVKKAEEKLGLQFSLSYKTFLKNFVGGEIGGEEIYSIYGMDFEDVCGGDIVYQNLMNVKNGTAKPLQLVVSETDFGEIYYFDYSKYQDGECPIYLRLPSGESKQYAANFYEFLCKRISAHLG
ncbi:MULTISPECIES: SMI1/KNR4 family protein [Providencia]|uniref:SMI1/KNR4 family protein n=1 Tax=Providencia TaxID=586 RepID=UPI0018C7B1AF|nr:SMI1/KNR4 family protein [Providencia stuartii]MBG5918799.1 SMI1/KNR4 family protein [Providencia stuartii]